MTTRMSNPDFTTYFNTTLFSDATLSYLTITGFRHELPVHRLILSLHSPFFASAFTLPFRESSSDPDHLNQKPTIHLHGDDPDALLSVIRWCYGHTLYQLDGDDDLETQLAYKDLITLSFTAEEEQAIAGLLLHLMKVYVMADKYDIPALREEVLVHYDRLAPLLVLHKLPLDMFEGMVDVIYGTGLGKGNKLRKKFMGDLAGEVCPADGEKEGKERMKKVLRMGNDWEMEEVEKTVREGVFKVRSVGMGREWKREFMRDVKRKVRRVVKRRWRGGKGSAGSSW